MATKPRALTNIEENRKSRLQQLINLNFDGNASAFARSAGMSRAAISQLLSESGRAFGENSARKIERKMLLPVGYFDIQDDNDATIDVNSIERLSFDSLENDYKQFFIDQKWLKESSLASINVSNSVIIIAVGDSMEPTIHPGDAILINKAINNFDADGIYLLVANEAFSLKRVTKDVMGRYVVSSDNPMIRQIDYFGEDIKIVGKAICALNIKLL